MGGGSGALAGGCVLVAPAAIALAVAAATVAAPADPMLGT
jgi:hypothetical protein